MPDLPPQMTMTPLERLRAAVAGSHMVTKNKTDMNAGGLVSVRRTDLEWLLAEYLRFNENGDSIFIEDKTPCASK